MILQLFVSSADNEIMTEQRLINATGVSLGSGQRWIAHLLKDGQVVARENGDDVTLTCEAIERMRKFLDIASREAHEIESNIE